MKKYRIPILYDLKDLPERNSVVVYKAEDVHKLLKELKRNGLKSNNLYLVLLWAIDKMILLILFLLFK